MIDKFDKNDGLRIFSFTVFAARQFHRRGIRRLLQFGHKMALAAITGPDAAAVFCL